MVTASENDILTQVGLETPMGRMMRRFWLPICASSEVAEPDSEPLRTQLLGESFVVFRDTSGTVGVLDEFCMHRRVSLALGRVEDGGIRCLFHGWKFGVDGTIQETPNHCNERFRERTKAPAYPVREAGGLVWTYIGPANDEPPFTNFSFFDGPDENRVVIRINADANYLQLFEGGCDSSHVAILHSNQANPAWKSGAAVEEEDFNPGAISVSDNAPVLDIQDTEYGYHYAAKRQGPPADDGSPTHSIRVTPVILPVGRIIPAPSFQLFVFEVPQTDHRTSTYLINHGPRPVPRSEILRIMGLDDDRFWSDDDLDFKADWADGLGQDRAAMSESWTGYSGIEQEDVILAISMGTIVDRSKETLVSADAAVVRLRRRLLDSVERSQAGQAPIAHGVEDLSGVAALADTVIGINEPWEPLLPNNRPVGEMAVFDPNEEEDESIGMSEPAKDDRSRRRGR